MYELKAFSGFRLDFFSVSVCDGSPCLNGGTCSVSAGGTADCACVPGYSGATCASKPKLNIIKNGTFWHYMVKILKFTKIALN